jgi:5-methyltetrahydropteroyltriglutamate--homocysteine methyltransferase
MSTTHRLGFPRIGKKRQVKRALEAYGQATLSKQALIATGKALRAEKPSLLPALFEAFMTFTRQTHQTSPG